LQKKSLQASSHGHVPVLLNEMLYYLAPKDSGVYVDATFGGGGYSRAILNTAYTNVIAIDRDQEAKNRAQIFIENYPTRFEFFLSNFGNIDTIVRNRHFDGVVFDFGLSSFQLEYGERGFSFQTDGPLDMRMGNTGLKAEEVINTFNEEDIFQIIKFYGEERFARKISRAILKNRPIHTTFELAKIVRSVIPRTTAIDPATKTFQAIRIFVNNELKEIEIALDKIVKLATGSNISQVCVVTVAFQSLEDRVVKNWIQRNKNPLLGSDWVVEEKVHKVVVPQDEEIKSNPRSRSARLRAVVVKNVTDGTLW
jgi:16S rRNA (cytosine1402-N4)-methyltransferase